MNTPVTYTVSFIWITPGGGGVVTDDYYGTGVDRVEVKINWGMFSVDRAFTRLRVEFVE